MQCVILAGGLGTRMWHLTEKVPKALVPAHGEPFATHQLRLLAGAGIDDVVYSIGYKGSMIRDAVGDGSGLGLSVQYVDEGEELRGTGGAIRLAWEGDALDESFLVLYGDAYLPINYEAVFESHQMSDTPALMTVYSNKNRWDRSNVVLENGRVELYEKNAANPPPNMTYIDYGLSVLDRALAADRIPADEFVDLADLFHDLSLEGGLSGYEVTERFYEVGSPDGLREFEDYIRGRP